MAPPKGHPRWGGRKPGQPNHLTCDIKAAIEQAFGQLGGAAYLVQVGKTDPAVLLALVGKVIPREIKAEIGLSIAALLRDSHSGANEPEKK